MKRLSIALRIIAFAVIAETLISPTTLLAAKMEASPLGNDQSSIITVEGDLELGDEKKFIDIALANPDSIVVLGSDGGNLFAGIEIGKAIRLKGYGTFVPDGVRCASACALAWLGGRVRAMGEGAKVGFHAASFKENGQITSAGNALIGAYLNQLGLPTSAVIYISEPPPGEIRWLTFAEAQQHGIDVTRLELSISNEKAGSATKPKTSPQASTTFPSALTHKLLAPYCHMGSCSWMSIESRESVNQGRNGELFKLLVRHWNSKHPNGSYDVASRRTGGQVQEQYVFCSRTKPATAFENEGKWIAHTLAPDQPDGVYGYNSSDYTLYFAACHGSLIEYTGFQNLAKSLGYRTDSARVAQVDLNAPADLMSLH